MIRNTAVWARAGLIPVAAALSLVCSAALGAEDSTPSEKDPVGAESKPAAQSAATSKPSEPAKEAAEAKDAKDTAESAKAEAAGEDKAAGDVAAKDNASADKADATEAQATGDKTTEAKSAEAKPAEAKPADAKSADAKPADAKSTETAAKPESDAKTPADAKEPEKSAAAQQPASDKTPAASEDKTQAAATDKPAADKHAEEKSAAGASNPVKGPESTAALQDHSDAAAPAAAVADQVLPPADPVLAAVRLKLPTAVQRIDDDDAAALTAFYGDLNGKAVWVSKEGLTEKGKAVTAEIRKADDWGLDATAFRLPTTSAGPRTAEDAAEDEITIAIAVLKYARYARGGRVNPSSISQMLDVKPPLLAPKSVLTNIAAASAPDAYLRGLHPKHEQFQRLRKVLLELRGTDAKVEEEEEPEDPALAVKLPPGRLLGPGRSDPQVALLRQRLKVPADNPADENVFDEKVADAVRAFQRENGLSPDALVGNNTRAVLNGKPKPVSVSGQDRIQLVLINMERWRWLPDELGDFYVWDNVPEALTRVVKNDRIIYTDKIIVGQPSWPTPSFSADMKTVVFHPSWGVPPGIKRKELLPLLRKSSGGGGLFGIFGGGYSSQAVLDAYNLRVSRGGRAVNPNQVDWNSVNIQTFDFQQPPGPKNPLGDVKFMFPNSHDVYMHDTPERHLFGRSMRALSHGCMRIQDPRRFAEVILGEDKGWSADKVRGMFNGYSSTIALDKHIPVHVTYVTARVDDNGKLRTYGDVYGLDGRTARALTGQSIRSQPVYDDGGAEAVSSNDSYSSGSSNQGYQRRKRQSQGPQTLSDVIGDMFSP